jgi:O-antigen ligase
MSENTYGLWQAVGQPMSLSSNGNNERYFLRKRLHYYLTLAVIATTLFSWFNLNSYLIILLLLCRLTDGGPLAAIRTAFRNIYFWAYSALFLIELAGLLYTHDLFAGWKDMESKATLMAIPFIYCAGPFTDNNGFRKLLTAYCLILAAVCLYCLSAALVEYHWQHDMDVFFYLQLTSAVGVNAVFFSSYVLVAVLFLLFSALSPISLFSRRRPAAATVRRVRVFLLFFFTGMLFLLSSRLMLLLLIAALLVYLIGRRRPKMKLTPVFSLCVLVLVALGLLATTDNPFSRRYRELNPEKVTKSIGHQPLVRTGINGVSLRVFMWRSAVEILNDGHAWVFGVSGGDSRIRLNQKYMDAGMSQGYLDYNFHNEYIETLVHSGIVGAIAFIFFISSLIRLARSAGTAEAAITVGMIILLCATESALEMQHGLFLCSFFPLLYLCRRPAAQ